MDTPADPAPRTRALGLALALSLPCWALGLGACRDRGPHDAAPASRAPRVDAPPPAATTDGAADAGSSGPTRAVATVSPIGPARMNAVGALALSSDGALVVAGSLDGALARSLSADGAPRWRAARSSGCDSPGTTALTVTSGGRAVAAELCRHEYSPDETAALWLDAGGALRTRRVLARGDVWVSALAVVGDEIVVAGSVTHREGRASARVLGRPLPPPHKAEMGFVARASATGAARWIKPFEHGVSALVTDPRTGDLLVAGYYVWDDTVAGRAVSQGQWVARLTGGGTTRWTQTFGAEGSDRVHALAPGPSGEVYVTAGLHQPDAPPGSCTSCALVARIEPDGRVAWRRLFDSATSVTRATGIAVGPDATVWVAGTFQRSLTAAGATLTASVCPHAGQHPADVFLWRLAPDGAPVEAWALGACGADVDARVAVDARNRVYVAGAARVPPRAEAPTGDGVTAFVARLDP